MKLALQWFMWTLLVLGLSAGMMLLILSALIDYAPRIEIETQRAALSGLTMVTVFATLSVATITALTCLAAATRLLRALRFSPVAMMLSLGVVALALPSEVRSLAVLPTQLTTRVITTLRMDSRDTAASGAETAGNFTQLSDQLFQAMDRNLTSIAKEIQAALTDLPYPGLLQAMALWTALSVLFSPPGGEWRWSLVGRFQDMSAPSRRNLLLAALLGLSGYLAIAAIVAIPWLEDDRNAGRMTKEGFLTRIDSVALSEAEFAKRYPEQLSAITPLQDLEKAIPAFEQRLSDFQQKTIAPPAQPSSAGDAAQAKDGAPPERAARIDAAVADLRSNILDLRSMIDDVRHNRLERLADWQEMRRVALAALVEDRRSLAVDFEDSLMSARSSRERNVYVRDLVHWMQLQQSIRGAALDETLSYLNRADANQQGWERETLQYCQREFAALETTLRDRMQTPRGQGRAYFTDLWYARPAPSVNAWRYGNMRPGLPDPGEGWGPFAWVAKWLLRTESMPLTVITGMVGFGLLGSALASAIRGARADDGALVENLGVVVMRGMSAALVMFLAVKGGLAVVAIGELEPNPYAMFFLCLVGAVFSDGVWDWARLRLEQWRQQSPRQPTPGAQKTPTP